MAEQQENEKPEVYALRKETDGWQISRRDFLKAAGAGAAAAGVLLRSGSVHAEEDLGTLCKDAPASENEIINMIASPDGQYLVTGEKNNEEYWLKLWNFDMHELVEKESVSDDYSSRLAFLSLNRETLLAVGEGSGICCFRSIPSLNLTATVDMSEYLVITAGTADDFYWVTGEEHLMHAVLKSGVMKIESLDDFDIEDVMLLSGVPSWLFFLDGGKQLLSRCSFQGDGVDYLDVYNMDSQKRVFSIYFKGLVSDMAVLPGDTKVLSCCEKTCCLHSLVDGEKIWELDSEAIQSNIAGASVSSLTHVAVLPDGMTAILSGDAPYLYWISLEDGSLLQTIPAPGSESMIAVKHDGTQIAAAAESRLWFYSLPDWKVIGCPVDLDEIKDDEKGITVEKTDPVSGQTITYTLPCGAEIPAGAVCTCNCVSGTIPTCSCVGHVSTCSCVGYVSTCSCVGHVSTCSCNSHRSTYSGSHYWHPN